ncbi:MAG: CvpA family protein [Bacteroidetes bacterium]|nr:MAG: CvpA family protein [Bacteroidota bacterium]TAG89094.1 MAG: CvpA family protein [Bacteroidota bacterium]
MNVSLVLDFLILAFLGWGGYSGYQKGLLEAVVGMLHFVIAFLICFFLVGFIISLVNQHLFIFQPDIYPEFIFATSIIASNYLLGFLEQYIKTEIEYDFPGQWDNIVGALFGAIKHSLILSFCFWFSTGVGSFQPNLTKNSFMYKFVENIALIVSNSKNQDELDAKIKGFVDKR